MPAGISSGGGGDHPGFQPYVALRTELLALPVLQWIERCNVLATRQGLRSAAGAPITFVVAEADLGGLGYEAAILHQGLVACRPGGRGAVHDLHNALVWLTFPRLKASLNRLHLAEGRSGGSGRGRVRDRVTLLDESGMLWISAAPELDDHLRAGRWHELLVGNRAQVRDRVLPIIVGHGLLEKLATPYKAMTAYCLVCPVDPAHLTPALIDTVAARHLDRVFDASAGPDLAPLPILGLPGWDPANVDASYYDDARVFRRQGRSRQSWKKANALPAVGATGHEAEGDH